MMERINVDIVTGTPLSIAMYRGSNEQSIAYTH